ncbi:hypothetical protein [Cryobacterium shii]|uniref:Uncharacterized protein n=1 Tax=Cryobacterium shii TaxID=1259235 RepID=A0AAQ2HF12_9MICO|nr:hypothetical protein [Cryobacterium shii]TFC44313.1 hypothetical protein E3O49_11710 [Cryobacterium shii]
MTEPRELRVLLVMYDLPKWLHKYLHSLFDGKKDAPRSLAYFDDWIRVQQSVLLVLTHLRPDALKENIFGIMALNARLLNDLNQGIQDVVSAPRMFVLDVTEADYAGTGLKDGWEWYELARRKALSSRLPAQHMEG